MSECHACHPCVGPIMSGCISVTQRSHVTGRGSASATAWGGQRTRLTRLIIPTIVLFCALCCAATIADYVHTTRAPTQRDYLHTHRSTTSTQMDYVEAPRCVECYGTVWGLSDAFIHTRACTRYTRYTQSRPAAPARQRAEHVHHAPTPPQSHRITCVTPALPPRAHGWPSAATQHTQSRGAPILHAPLTKPAHTKSAHAKPSHARPSHTTPSQPLTLCPLPPGTVPTHTMHPSLNHRPY